MPIEMRSFASNLLMEKIHGYIKTICNYYNDVKGHHDIVDYLRAISVMIMTMSIVFAMIYFIFEK